MVVANPCCGCMPLQTGTKVLAIIDMVLSVLLGILLTIAVVAGFAVLAAADGDKEDKRTAAIILIVFTFILLLITGAQFFLALILFHGASQKNLARCRIWFIVSIILLVLNLAFFVYDAVVGLAVGSIITKVLSIGYHLYALWVVFAFMEELRGEPVSTNGP